MFDKVLCINLKRRADRWEQFLERFPADWSYAPPERWEAVDGTEDTPPDWYTQSPGAWGCYWSHISIWEAQIDAGWQSVLVLEDDAVFCRGAVGIIARTMELVPDGWDQVYFGGQHLDTNEYAPEVVVQDELIRCNNVNRTHAYAISKRFAEVVIDCSEMIRALPARMQHVDYMLGEMHKTREYNIYAPWRFCVGQATGTSDVVRNNRGNPRHSVEHFWNQFPIVEPAGAR